MANKLLAIGVGAAQGFEKAATNIHNIGIARQKLDRDNARFDLDIKAQKAKIKQVEFDTSPEQVRRANDLIDAKIRTQKATAKEKELQISEAERTNKSRAETSKNAMDIVSNILRGVDVPGDASVKLDIGDGSSLTIKEPTEKETTINTQTKKQLADLSGKVKSGHITTFKQVEDIVAQNQEALQFNQVDTEFILEEARKILPETFDRATNLEKFRNIQEGDRRVKDGILEEKDVKGKWKTIKMDLDNLLKDVATFSEAKPILKEKFKVTDEEAKAILIKQYEG